MTAPKLPREVWAYVRTWPGKSHGMKDLETFQAECMANERREYDARRGFGERLSPVGRYVLVDEERERQERAVILAAKVCAGICVGDPLPDALAKLFELRAALDECDHGRGGNREVDE